MAKFELVSKYVGQDDLLPNRKTKDSAGYDFFVAEDTLIPPYEYLMGEIVLAAGGFPKADEPVTLEEMAALTKSAMAKPTLVSLGTKCEMADDEYLTLHVRSSTPLKYWLVMANSVGRRLF